MASKGPFRLSRYFSLAALLLISVAIFGLSYMYRQIVIADLARSGEAHNAGLTAILSNLVMPEFGPFLRSASSLDGDTLRAHPEIQRLDQAIRKHVHGTAVIKIYTMNGHTVYSSEAKQIGEDKSGNAGFRAARDGGLASEITHRNQFSAFDQIIEERGVLSSYIPVRNAAGQVEGVFELYDDITPLIELLDQSQVKVTLGAAAVLLLLYGALLTIVRRADRILKAQHTAQQSYEIELESRITERTAALVQARDDAQAANRAKSEFLANMSHELRTPLNGVLGMTELLMGTGLNDKQLQCANTAYQSGTALLNIINDLLDFSKIEAGKLSLEIRTFELRPLVANLYDVLAPMATAKGLKFNSQIDPLLEARFSGDPGRVRQVLSNLVHNAIKFTKTGEVTIRISRNAASVDIPGVQHLRFDVEDTGPGITLEQQTQLFQSFSQLDNSSTRKYGGTGLGLAISLQLVELMGGKIGVDSKPGRGSRFWFSVPLAPAVEDAKPADASNKELSVGSGATKKYFRDANISVAAEKSHRMRLLLAEDNSTNQTVTTLALSSLGYEVDVVRNGLQAVNVVKHGQYDVVLMDCHMPEMDGYEATRAIRAWEAAQGKGGHLQIVALTARAMKDDRDACLAAGMDDYLAKPFTREQLDALLARAHDRLRS